MKKPVKTTNSNMRPLVQARKEFVASNVFGTWETDDVYVVYSYGKHFPMYVFCWEDFDEGISTPRVGIWYGNTDKYSRSTTKHQTQARPQQVLANWHNTQILQDIIRYGIAGTVARRMA